MNMNSFRKFAMVAGLLLVSLFIVSAVTPTFAWLTEPVDEPFRKYADAGVTVSPYPDNAISKRNAYTTAGYLAGLPDYNPANDFPGVNNPGSISVSFQVSDPVWVNPN